MSKGNNWIDAMIDRVAELNRNMPDGEDVVSADSILDSKVRECGSGDDTEGRVQEIASIWKACSDAETFSRLFHEFTGVSYEVFLQECIDKVTRNPHVAQSPHLDRMFMIKQYDATVNKELRRQEREDNERTEHLKRQIMQLSIRIQEMIKVANACIDSGIPLVNVTESRTGESRLCFVREYKDWIDGIGFLKNPYEKEITEMGIYNPQGQDFHTNGIMMYSSVMVDSFSRSANHQFPPDANNMKKFVAQFDAFEKKFYDYVDTFLADALNTKK